MRWLAPLLGCLLLAVPTLAVAQVNDPPVIVDAFERARAEGKIDLALSYFADDATVFVQDRGVPGLIGKADIRRFLQQTTRTPPLITSSRHVVGNTITWTERHQGQPPRALDLQVEAIVQDGKIKSLTYALATQAAQPSTSADGPARLPASYALAALSVLSAGLLVAAFALPRRRASVSTLHGKLLSGLREARAASR